MSQSLLNRFRGTLFGVIIARKMSKGKETLINGEIINQKIIIDLIKYETISRETCQAIAATHSSMGSGEFILNILSLILFFHETEPLLSKQLEKINKQNDLKQEMIKDVLLFRQIINLIFKQENDCLKNIPDLDHSLEKLQIFLKDQTPLTELKRQFRQQTIIDNNYLLLSLYCFARTSDNFKLSILQAFQWNHPVILGITAVLSGAYNGYFSIPIPWRLNINQDNKYDPWEQQIVQLWAKWVGVDDLSKTIKPLDTQVIQSVKGNNR
ncbi:MAG: ADP-ribosylglycohydrolase family protein [Crocosphaera sp.]|nr:ADP-ribosylglycohydrolase family protein [Crocosphaera sp.]